MAVPPLAVRLPAALVLALLGAAASIAAILLHTRWWGLVLGLAAAAASLVALPGAWWARLAFALGWVGALAAFAGQRPEGDYLVAADRSGYLLLAAGLAVLVAGVVGLRPARREPARRAPEDAVGSDSSAPAP